MDKVISATQIGECDSASYEALLTFMSVYDTQACAVHNKV